MGRRAYLTGHTVVAGARAIRFNGVVSADQTNEAAALDEDLARRQALKAAIEKGEYRVDCDAVAAAIVTRLLESSAPTPAE